ncbi:MAG: tRNA (adenosine(37)-N6)-threonylcarbamoyltransferase complex ATPase subunit type 1 TsaE [Nitrospinaceae bacterium]
MEFITDSAAATLSLGRRLGQTLGPGSLVLMMGCLGAGKTTLVQGLTQGLGVPPEEYVRSPTFTLINQYQGFHPIFHVDLYRLQSVEEITELGLEDLDEKKGVILVEWAEKLLYPNLEGKEALLWETRPRIEIRIEILTGDRRRLDVNSAGYHPAERNPLLSLQ